MNNKLGRWILGLVFIFAVATIWIAASFVVQSVVDAGVSPFLITYICNSLFIVYIPLAELGRYLEDSYGGVLFWRSKKSSTLQQLGDSEQDVLLGESDLIRKSDGLIVSGKQCSDKKSVGLGVKSELDRLDKTLPVETIVDGNLNEGLDAKGRWTRSRVAKVSLIISPVWFLAQLTFNLSLKYTTVTSNTILSSGSSLYTFLLSLYFLGEVFTWVKLVGVLLCTAGTIMVSLGDSGIGLKEVATNPFLGDILALLSAGLYAVYVTLIGKKLPDDDGKSGQVSMAEFLGYLGLFNLFIFLPIALLLNFTGLESFKMLTWKQLGVIVGKGLLDNVLSDYLWAKAVVLTTTTVATAGLAIQVPLAAVVDSVTGHAPRRMDYLGAVAVMIGFAGINIPSDGCGEYKEENIEVENERIWGGQDD